jgi:uncharacterized SAM-binding protein YcdF (DUF218 family)
MIKFVALLLSLFSGAVLSTMVVLWMAAGEIYDYQDTYQPGEERVDVVLCLAGGKHRIPIAIELFDRLTQSQSKSHPTLFLSGVGPQAGFETLIEQGVSKEVVAALKKEKVVFENVSENTYENAQIFSTFARQNKWKRVVLVTAGYHMRRAEFILHKTLDQDVNIETATVDAIHFGRNEWHKDAYAVRVTLIEYIKWLYYRYSY